jgi:hypothetical protein
MSGTGDDTGEYEGMPIDVGEYEGMPVYIRKIVFRETATRMLAAIIQRQGVRGDPISRMAQARVAIAYANTLLVQIDSH